MKNILILDTGKEWGGGTNSLLYLLNSTLSEKYRFIVVFFYNYKNDYISIKESVEKGGHTFIHIKQHQRWILKLLKEIVKILFFFNRKLKKEILFLLEYFLIKKGNIKEIQKIINSYNINLIYGNNQISSNLEGIISAKQLKKPYIQHLRITAPIKFFEYLLIKNHISLMLANSQGTFDYFKKLLPMVKMEILPNAIEIYPKIGKDTCNIRNKLNINKNTIILVSIGSLIERKRFDVFIKAIAELKSLNIIALIIGNGREKENLEKLAIKLKVKEKILFLGFRSDVLEILKESDIFISSADKEPFGRVFLEAMLCKKPIISSDNMLCKQLVINNFNGYLFKYSDVNQLSLKIELLIKNKELRKIFGINSYNLLKEKFDIKEYLFKLDKYFESLL